MPEYKLYYFEITGRGETARMMFHYANVPFEDIRIKFDEWGEMKPSKSLLENWNHVFFTYFSSKIGFLQ